MRWLIHDAVIKDRLSELLGVIGERGDEAVVIGGREPRLPEPDGRPTLGLVTVQAARRIHREAKLRPGVFWSPTAFSQTSWVPWFGRWALNDDMVWLPWAEFLRRGPFAWRHFAADGCVFIRPDSGLKTFTGQTFGLADFSANAAALDATSGVTAGTLIGVCRPKPIDHGLEWRFWLRRGGVIASTPYSWQDGVTTAPAPPQVAALADEIAASCADEGAWAPDSVFVADLCLSGGRPRLVELNSASCSGLYQADIAAVLGGLAEAVQDEVALG